MFLLIRLLHNVGVLFLIAFDQRSVLSQYTIANLNKINNVMLMSPNICNKFDFFFSSKREKRDNHMPYALMKDINDFKNSFTFVSQRFFLTFFCYSK